MKPHARRKARSLVLQALYQWQLTGDIAYNIKRQFDEKINPKKVDVEYFNDLLEGVIRRAKDIDVIIEPLLDRKMKDLDSVELAVLRLATYELKYRLDVPHKVVINEALELAKSFGSIDGYKYINGVLDKVACSVREG